MSSDRKKKRLNAMLERFGDRGFDLLQRFFLVKDIGVAERRGAKLGDLWYRLDRKHRERCLSNLKMAFPELGDAEREKLSREVFRHFGRVAGDFLRSPMRTDEEVLAKTEVEGIEHFHEARDMKRGILAVTAHLGNWERFAHWATSTGESIAVVARDANQSGVQEKLLKMREGAGIEVLSRGNAARSMLALLRKGRFVGILPDQNSAECFVPFFGMSTGTVLGPAVIHQRTGSPLLPVYCVKTGVGAYRVIIRPIVDAGNEEQDPEKLTAELNAVLESVIRQYPEQWLWMHDRWKESRLKGLV